MNLLDPYGLGPSTPDNADASPDQPIAVPERQEEVDLAAVTPASEQQPVNEDLSLSGLDPALRLQDGVGTWPRTDDVTPDEIGSADAPDPAEPDPQPFAPLSDSGGQGI
jgi:hypothetical protein